MPQTVVHFLQFIYAVHAPHVPPNVYFMRLMHNEYMRYRDACMPYRPRVGRSWHMHNPGSAWWSCPGTLWWRGRVRPGWTSRTASPPWCRGAGRPHREKPSDNSRLSQCSYLEVHQEYERGVLPSKTRWWCIPDPMLRNRALSGEALRSFLGPMKQLERLASSEMIDRRWSLEDNAFLPVDTNFGLSPRPLVPCLFF